MTTHLPNALRALIESGPLTYLSTTNADASPHVTAIWIGLDGDDLVTTHMRFNAKLRNIQRDPRVALSFAPPQQPGDWLSPYATIYATATIEPEGPTGKLLTRLAKAYVGPEAEFPNESQTGFVVRYRIDRIGGIGPWINTPPPATEPTLRAPRHENTLVRGAEERLGPGDSSQLHLE